MSYPRPTRQYEFIEFMLQQGIANVLDLPVDEITVKLMIDLGCKLEMLHFPDGHQDALMDGRRIVQFTWDGPMCTARLAGDDVEYKT